MPYKPKVPCKHPGCPELVDVGKGYDKTIPNSPEEWLEQFETFSIYQVLPQLIELWGLNTQTQVEAKKNFAKLTAK